LILLNIILKEGKIPNAGMVKAAIKEVRKEKAA
jgi:hypothetical protein